MLNELTHWLSQKHNNEVILFLWAFLFFDSTRYLLCKLIVFAWDLLLPKERTYSHCPKVSILLAGYNEAAGIKNTLASLWGTYPDLDIIIIDDGSTDKMAEEAREFAKTHKGISIIRRETRGGKASALNYGFLFAKGEIIMVIDTDSILDRNSVWEIVQPFADEEIGAVAGTILPRNMFVNLVTWFQSYEYLHSIFIGRLVSCKLGLLGIVSGAYGAFRKDIWQRCQGMDVGPPEDLDFTIRIRKAGYKVAFAPFSNCYTDVPDTWIGLIKQRFRWEQGGVVRNHCRKHNDMLNYFSENFKWSNFFLWIETFYFDFLCPYIIIAYFLWLVAYTHDLFYCVAWLYFCYLFSEFVQILVCFFYSTNFWRDLIICAIAPLLFFYRTLLLLIRAIANMQELFLRVSFKDNYVPKHVRESTWHW